MHIQTTLKNMVLERTIRTGLVSLTLGVAGIVLSETAAIAQSPANANASLTVNVTGLREAGGQVCFSLFEGSQGFPNDESAVVAQQCVPTVSEEKEESAVETQNEETSDRNSSPEAANVTVTFDDLAMGTYAVSVLHDENEDQQINQGSFGIPTEGFGFSENPEVQTSAPEFAEAAVFVLGETTTDIEMIYF